ncbi:hypothetical protein [Candidatus Contubernalis alkaliaceticus]|uniref:hypothetical protein n=1 Tax=Candidatus Contubernalis alkaliaceticus TaxID=338645 RepID=UPI001F4C1792|nr:hypothetical protein [Candidatus Contubernalis alkalaceticus]UNC91231.1 hypothetical protein HUE98_03490 [Candidatus Contubernalis alkalaceticus]
MSFDDAVHIDESTVNFIIPSLERRSRNSERTIKKSLRYLALKQQADGSFADSPEDKLYKKLKITALSLSSFLLAPDEIRLYKKQLLRSIKYLLDNEGEYTVEPVSKEYKQVHSLVALSLKLLEGSELIRGKLKIEADRLTHKLFSGYNQEKTSLFFEQNVPGINVVREIFKTLNLELEERLKEFDFEKEYIDAMDLALSCLALTCHEQQ